MLHVTEILGDAGEPRFASRKRETVLVSSGDASKRRLRLTTEVGTDVAVDLPRGSYLREGAVLADDGRLIVVVERAEEEVLVVRISTDLPASDLVEAAARIGHAFGNQHVPLDVDGGAILVPITTSAALAEQTVRALGLTGIDVGATSARLGRLRPLGSPAHGHGHGHAHEH